MDLIFTERTPGTPWQTAVTGLAGEVADHHGVSE